MILTSQFANVLKKLCRLTGFVKHVEDTSRQVVSQIDGPI